MSLNGFSRSDQLQKPDQNRAHFLLRCVLEIDQDALESCSATAADSTTGCYSGTYNFLPSGKKQACPIRPINSELQNPDLHGISLRGIGRGPALPLGWSEAGSRPRFIPMIGGSRTRSRLIPAPHWRRSCFLGEVERATRGAERPARGPVRTCSSGPPVVLLQKGALEPDSDPARKQLILLGLDGAP